MKKYEKISNKREKQKKNKSIILKFDNITSLENFRVYKICSKLKLNFNRYK